MKTFTSAQVLAYIKKIHKKGFKLDSVIASVPQWELKKIDIDSLELNEFGEKTDPYNRVLDIDFDYVDDLTDHDIATRPIVADSQGYIIDGNHRATKALELGMSTIPAFVPVLQLEESAGPGEYVYHAGYMPRGLDSVLRKGLLPSADGYAGPGVYFAYDPEGGYYHVDKEQATMFRVKWADLVAKFGAYPENPNGIERDDEQIIVPGTVPASMLQVEYFPGEWWDIASAVAADRGPVDEAVIEEGALSIDVPTEDWLQDKIDYAKSKGRNSYGVPYMGSTTASVRGTPPRVRVMRLASLPGMRNEQTNVRRDDLKWLMDYMERTGKLPPGNNPDDEYLPYIMVAYNGEAWVNEGNHRIMAAYRLNWPDMPIEIRYFDGGERVRDGAMYPGKIGLGEVPTNENLTEADTKVTDFIDAVYTKYPQTFQNNHVMPLGGTGDDQQFAMFELTPSFSRRGAVEVKWIQAYPLRQGVGSRAMQELQALAKDAGIALTLFPWDKGQVSQAKLTKFYRGQGFKPTMKGAKNMAWTPESLDEAFDQPYPMSWEKSEADDSMDALARLPDGSNLSIMFNMEYDEEGEEVIQVEFHRNNSQEVTGDGDAQRVFATVLAAIQQYIKVHNPKRLTFSASKEVEPDQNSESRAKLYDRLVIRYARTWGYRPLRADTGSIVRYELSRLKPVVAEGKVKLYTDPDYFGAEEFVTESTGQVIGPFKLIDVNNSIATVEGHKPLKLSASVQDRLRPGYNYAFDIVNGEVAKVILMVVDAVIYTDTEVLLIKRKGEPYAGHWALPGGFVEPGESVADAAKRELQEETGLVVNNVQPVGEFKTPNRDPRMENTWSYAFKLHLKDRGVVHAGDDASAASWIPREQLSKLPLAFDHSAILAKALTLDEQVQPELTNGEVQLFKPRVVKLLDKDVAEDLNETTSQLGPQLYTPHPKNLDESMKPKAALWTSTASGGNNGYTSAWVEWAKSEMPQWVGHSGFLYDVSPNARILTINSDRDAMRVAKKYGMNTMFKWKATVMDLFMYMPWIKIAKDYDAIHHVPSNRGADHFMHSWDVESTAWFNTKMLLNKRKVPIVAEGLDEAVGGNYLYHSTQDANTAKQILSSGYILGSNSGKQPASDAQTTLPTVSFGRSIGYQTSGVNVDRDYQVVFVFDRASIETRYKTLGTSQSQNVRGLANPIDTEWGGKVAKLGKVWGLDANADGKVDYKEIGNVSKSAASNMVKKGVSAKLNAPKAGGEFEEIVPTKTGKIPLQGLLVGFYLVPGKAASKDPELLNDPRRLDMPRPNQFVKAAQQQGVAEGLDEAVGGNYLYHATGSDINDLKNIISNGLITNTGNQERTGSKLRAVSFTRNWRYALTTKDDDNQEQSQGIANGVIFVVDESILKQKNKMQSVDQPANIVNELKAILAALPTATNVGELFNLLKSIVSNKHYVALSQLAGTPLTTYGSPAKWFIKAVTNPYLADKTNQQALANAQSKIKQAISYFVKTSAGKSVASAGGSTGSEYEEVILTPLNYVPFRDLGVVGYMINTGVDSAKQQEIRNLFAKAGVKEMPIPNSTRPGKNVTGATSPMIGTIRYGNRPTTDQQGVAEGSLGEAVGGNFLYHGSESANISGLLRTSERDSGWFGSGFYLTAYPEYTKRWGQFVYQTPWPKGNYAMVTVIGDYAKITFDENGQLANNYAGGDEGWIRDEHAWSAKFKEFLVKKRFVGIRVAFDNKPDVEVVIFDPNTAGVKLTRADQKPTVVAKKEQGVAEGKIKLYTDPGYFGAEVDDAGFDSLPIVNISADRLVGFEPDDKMKEPTSRANVKKILAGIKQGDKLPPLLVRKYKDGYQVLDGHHRFWAYKLSGVKSIPVQIVPDSDIEEISKQGVAEAETGTAHADQIEKEFTALGYKQVGSGADSTVWAKDKGHIIKILMPDPGSQAEQVFTKFYEFCLAHQNLECLPVINEHNKISVLDREYTQIDMERLSPIKKNSFNEGVVWFFSDFVAGDESWDAVDHALGLADTWTEYNPRQAANLAKYWQDLTFADDNSKFKELHTLYGVMQILYKAGRINKFGWDLHTENVMQRKNGQLVIIDPWFADSALNESAQLPEARANPDQNTRPASGMKELQAVAKTLGDIKNWAISMTAEPKLGINPQVGISEDTPKGVYFYPLDYALGLIQRRQPLPWGDKLPYIQLFQYDRSAEMTKETTVDSAKLKQAVGQYCSQEVIQSAIDEPEYDGTPYWFIYDCLSRLGKSDETNIVRWNKVLRDLGFTSVFDPGHGWIAYNEPTQGVVLDPRVIKQLRTIDNKKESGVITPALIEQTLFDNLDVELAGSRAWQAWDPDGSKLRQHCKEWAQSDDFKPWFGKDASALWDEDQKLMGLIGYYRRTVGREINNQAWEWYKEQQTQKTESITEGGWASAATQNTVITPHVIEEAINVLDHFEREFNAWQAENELDVEIRMGKPVGSGTYYKRDLTADPTREYGDVDVVCYIHSREGVGAARRTSEYADAVKSFADSHTEYNTSNGTNVIMDTSAGPIQVDLIYTYNEHADWARALAPEYRVKGVISTSLMSSVAEVLNMSFGIQGVQVKTRGGQPVSFRQSKDTQLSTVSIDPHNWGGDMYSYYYQLAHGTKPVVPGNLAQHGGLKDEQRLSDIVKTIHAMAKDFETAELFGTGALDSIANSQDFMQKISRVYAEKLDKVINSSKFDKAATPGAVEKANKTRIMLAKYRNEIAKLLVN